MPEAYSEYFQTSKMEPFAKTVNAVFAKISILDIWQGSEYASGCLTVLEKESRYFLNQS